MVIDKNVVRVEAHGIVLSVRWAMMTDDANGCFGFNLQLYVFVLVSVCLTTALPLILLFLYSVDTCVCV